MIKLFRKHYRGKSIKHKGFTLIELLIVMLILAVIAGIATPIYLNQKSRAQRSVAESVGRAMLSNFTSQLLGVTSFGTANGTIVVNSGVTPATVTIALGSGATSPAVFTEALTTGVTASGVTYANTTQWCLAVVKEGQTVIFTDAGFTNTQTSCGLTPGVNASSVSIASGGTLTSDATYYYRAFTASGTFTITGASLTVDYLVIAGGGAGASIDTGTNNASGAGGAGGYLSASNQTLATTSYPVTIGAGGTVNSGATGPGNGSNSTFNALVALGGGAGGQYNAVTGNSGVNGGSGGGSRVSGAIGLGTVGQGFDGGMGGNQGGGGGGGGAGGTGGSRVLNEVNGGTGGLGSNAHASWLAVTGLGAAGFIAGGGGGGSASTGTGGAATGGGVMEQHMI